MKEKKTAKADLRSKRGLFIEIGLIIVLALVYMVFEGKSYKTGTATRTVRPDGIIDPDWILLVPPDKIELPPPPPQTVLLKPIDNDKNVEKDPEIDVGITSDTPIPDLPPLVLPPEVPPEDEPFLIVEQNPEYTGGDAARLNFLRNNIKYPQVAREIGIQGTVYVSFVVEKDGSITQVTILRGIGGGCDEEAIRVTKLMPKWKPGKQRGKEVRVSYNMPIKFTLHE
ncbi:MAG: energy transducer TonB [Bacteroidales bacterium]|nr:energy transducer TonB [Bacteroidales bacterium]